MNISDKNMISPEEILSDVLKLANDEDFKDNSKGYYTSLIQQALQELAFDTFFDERTEFFDVPENLNLEMPLGAFNLKQIYLYNGTECNFGNAQNVYWKRNYYTKGSGSLARDNGTGNSSDPFYQSRGGAGGNPDLRRTGGSVGSTYFYNIQRGMIMLSSNSRSFQKVAIVFNGTGGDIGEALFIPQFLREAVKGWVLDPVYKVKMAQSLGGADFNKWQTLWSMNESQLRKPYTGIWDNAEYRIKSMDSKARGDMKEYMSRLDY